LDINAIRLVKIGKILATVDIRTSEGFIIRGFKVIEGENGLFVGMPSERTRTGKYIDLVKISDPNLREMLETIVLDAFQKKMK
jgi:stage V sporulation protein G